MFLQEIVTRLRDAGLRASVEHPDCIVVPRADGRAWWFGTVNPTWCGDLQTEDLDVLGTLDTGVPRGSEDVDVIALGILRALSVRTIATVLMGGTAVGCVPAAPFDDPFATNPTIADQRRRDRAAAPLTQLTAGTLLDLLRRTHAHLTTGTLDADALWSLTSDVEAAITFLRDEIGGSHMGGGADVVLVEKGDA